MLNFSASDRKTAGTRLQIWEWRDTVVGLIQNVASAISSLMFVVLLEPPE